MNEEGIRLKVGILVVDDCPDFAFTLKSTLERELAEPACEVAVIGNGEAAVQVILEKRPALVILDYDLPGKNGLEVCRAIRPKYTGQILMVSGVGGVAVHSEGLDRGADAYLAKPFDRRVLLAEVRKLLRSRDVSASAPKDSRLVIDRRARQVHFDGRRIELAPQLMDLLICLAACPGIPMGRDELHRAITGGEWDGLQRTVDQAVVHLRRKLGDDAERPWIVLTHFGVGYSLAEGLVPAASTYASSSPTA